MPARFWRWALVAASVGRVRGAERNGWEDRPLAFDEAVELVGKGVDAVGVAIVVIGSVSALLPYLWSVVRGQQPLEAYRKIRRRLGRAILLGLEFLVAGDIIRTVAVAPTPRGVGVLGIIILIRTFLSISLEVEIQGRWPWARTSRTENPQEAIAG